MIGFPLDWSLRRRKFWDTKSMNFFGLRRLGRRIVRLEDTND